MEMRDAIEVMRRSPNGVFPWKNQLIILINNLSALRISSSATTEEILEAIELMAPNARDALLSVIVNFDREVGEINTRDGVVKDVDGPDVNQNKHIALNVVFGLVMLIFTTSMFFKVGNGISGEDVVELVRIVVDLFKHLTIS